MEENEIIENENENKIEDTPAPAPPPPVPPKKNNDDKILKKLGVKNLGELESKLKEYEDLKKQSLSETERLVSDYEQTKNELSKSKLENQELETKFNVISSGVQSEYVEDVCLIIKGKVNDDNSFEDVLANLKEKSPFYFGEVQVKNGGTGTRPLGGNQRKIETKNGVDMYCEQLKERIEKQNEKDRKTKQILGG